MKKTDKDAFSVYQAYDFTWYAANFIDIGFDDVMITVGVYGEEIELMRTGKPNPRREIMSKQELRYIIDKGWVKRVA